MNKEQTKAFIAYCYMIFGHINVSVDNVIARLDADAKAVDIDRLQYLEQVVANSEC